MSQKTFIETPGTKERLEQPAFRQSVLDRSSAGRIGTVDVPAAVVYLASPAAGLVTGSVHGVDGGWTRAVTSALRPRELDRQR